LSIPVYADHEVLAMGGAVVGGNAADLHLRFAAPGRDFQVAQAADLRVAVEGDGCPRCEGGHFKSYRGIEVGHVFFLGTKYSKPMNCTFLDAEGKSQPMVMGCYGIGVTRTEAAAIEQNHDDGGIIWPMAIAPFQVALLSLQPGDAEVQKTSDELHSALEAAGIEVLYDDRDERPGSKFKDADLVGVPLRVAVGKKSLAEGFVELKHRRDKDAAKVKVAEIVAEVQARIARELAGT
jgi:prolyl-tRNA synthetase